MRADVAAVWRRGSVLPPPLRPGQVDSPATAALRAEVIKGLALRQAVIRDGIRAHLENFTKDVIIALVDAGGTADDAKSDANLAPLMVHLVQYSIEQWKKDGLDADAVASLPFPAAIARMHMRASRGVDDGLWLLPSPVDADVLVEEVADDDDDDGGGPSASASTSTSASAAGPSGMKGMSSYVDDECAVCMTNDNPLVLLMPCRHICVCAECAKGVVATGGCLCPTCRCRIRKVIQMVS